jgi:hypothetical protein
MKNMKHIVCIHYICMYVCIYIYIYIYIYMKAKRAVPRLLSMVTQICVMI